MPYASIMNNAVVEVISSLRGSAVTRPFASIHRQVQSSAELLSSLQPTKGWDVVVPVTFVHQQGLAVILQYAHINVSSLG